MLAPFVTDMPQRILSLWFPQLSAEREMRRRYGPSWRSLQPKEAPPLVFSRRENNTQRIATLDRRAKALNLKPGMGIAEARALHPQIEVIEAAPVADRRLLDAVADWCDRYTPLVAIDECDGLFLDITGCAHLFGGEWPMLIRIRAQLLELGFDTDSGVASTPGAAWAAARFMKTPTVAPGGEAAFIEPLPLRALRLDADICAGLESVGLRTVGSLMARPRAPLVRRFGKQVTLRLDQALGNVEEAISPRLPVPSLSVERQLTEPISSMADVEALVALLACQLKKEMERRCEGAERLLLLLFRVDGEVSRIAVGASRPLRDPTLIGRLFHERLQASATEIDAGFGFDLVRLCVLVAARLDAVQADLGGEMADVSKSISHFADRIGARLGGGTITMPVLLESHLPERAVLAVPFQRGATDSGPSEFRCGNEARQAVKERPIRLFDAPECVEVTATAIPDGPPAHFRWRRTAYRIAHAEGPERIAPEWWLDAENARTRDYFRVEDEDGRRYWLYRQGHYGAADGPPRWFIQGVFA